MYDTQIQNELG